MGTHCQTLPSNRLSLSKRKKMNYNGFLIFLALIHIIWARPQVEDLNFLKCEPTYTWPDGRAAYGIEPYDEQVHKAHFNYSCVSESSCNDYQTELTPFSEDEINELKGVAATSKCDTPGDICCPGDLIKPPRPTTKICSDESGYRCVLTRKCNGNVSSDPNMSLSCDDDTGTPQLCCKVEEIEPDDNPPVDCSALKDYKCVQEEDCKGNGYKKRNFGFLENLGKTDTLIKEQAKTAKCGKNSEVCCHKANIYRPCEHYEPDGYECTNKCLDTEQDEPQKPDRKSNIDADIKTFYYPKTTKCPENQQCCRRQSITATCCDGSVVTGYDPVSLCPECPEPKECNEYGDDFQCLKLRLCDKDNLAIGKRAESKKDTVSTLFNKIPGKLLSASTEGKAVINTKYSANCPDIEDLCCKPLPIGGRSEKVCDPETTCSGNGKCEADGSCQCEEGFTEKDCSVALPGPGNTCNWPFPENCGIHNAEGINRDMVPNLTSQEGEWPHACLIYEKGTSKAIGGASLITPKVLVTAAHKLERPDGSQLASSDLKIRCGDWDLASYDRERHSYQEIDVDTFTIHPKFTGSNPSQFKSFVNNIALIHTTKKFKQAKNVNTICLPKPSKGISESLCWTMGWGINELDSKDSTNIMKQIIMNRETDRSECEKKIKATKKISKQWKLHSSQLCAHGLKDKNKGKQLCKGDGGGPLVCREQSTDRHVLSGVVSWSIGCGEDDVPDVFSSVEDALCFISADIKCKHGDEFLEHAVHPVECENWYQKELEIFDKKPAIWKQIFGKYGKKLNEIMDDCKGIDFEVDISKLGKRSVIDAICDE